MQRKREQSFLELNNEYLLMYMGFLKEERVWESTGQYWLAKETSIRAKALLNGNVEEALKPIRSEKLFFHKHKHSFV
tara:strand:+ start:6740 stop:6970 length:231 start_codon:yes stop_codon:yes gene_type:complete